MVEVPGVPEPSAYTKPFPSNMLLVLTYVFNIGRGRLPPAQRA